MPEPEPEELLTKARRCRVLASSTLDERTAKTLREMALEYEQRAQLLAAKQKPPG